MKLNTEKKQIKYRIIYLINKIITHSPVIYYPLLKFQLYHINYLVLSSELSYIFYKYAYNDLSSSFYPYLSISLYFCSKDFYFGT